ncbi:cleavage and polyadenylation specificity factor subunit 2 [Dissophora globulifera]|nr:cleavage and polyadenylation specificity factor subunit 2 [Dissophora globulifera]
MSTSYASQSQLVREDCRFLKQTPPKVHNQRLTIQHWQLRDLITCPETSEEFIYVNQNAVNCYNTRTQLTTALMKELTFQPTSLTAACGYLAAGGQRNQLMVRQMNSNWFAHTSVGGSINNALCISEHLGGTRLLISNNDETIKVYSLPGLQRLTSIQLPTAVNYTSVSPDGRKMVAVGDSNQVFLYDISVAAGYQKIGTYTATTEASFSCAWNQSSDKFAVASQDGYVSVWDIRSSEKLCKLGSKQQPQSKGATRCVKFTTSGSIDLLVYSEHVSYVNLVDARTFNERQVVRVAPPNNDEHISGIALSPDSDVCFVGLEHSVLEYSVDTPSAGSPMESNYIRFTALSGAKSESALCYLLEIDEAKILLDCGWNDAFDVEDLKQLKRIAKDVDACLLSHSTLHHLGALAYAKTHLGLRAQTYATFPVMDMGRLSLYDIWQSKRASEDFTTFNLEDIDQAFEAITCLRYQQPTELSGKCKGITITASSAGHTVGGTIWKISKDTESILYAVDYNHRKDKHLDATVLLQSDGSAPQEFQRPSLMITDAFNSEQLTQPTRLSRDRALLESTMATLNIGGSVLLPTDSSTRVLELAYMFDSYWMANRVRYPLILLTNFSYRTAHFATSMMEWMGDTVRSQLTDTRENPFQFKYLRLCQRLSDLDKYPGPKVILASNLSMETGFAREVFLKMGWSQDPRNTLILTERALPGELARYLYDEWKEGVGNLASKDVGNEVRLDSVLRLKVDRKVLLEGQELAVFLADQEARLEREHADALLMEQSRRTLQGEEDDSDDDEGSMDGDANHLVDIDMLLSKTGSHDVYMKDATKSGGFFKQTQSYRMFPYVERRKKIDDYGESIVVEHFLSASSTAPQQDGREGRNGPGGDMDANGDVRMRGDDDDDDAATGAPKNESGDGKDKWTDTDMIHPEDNLPSKYASAVEDIVVKCKVRYVDLEGRADESAMKTILQAIAPRKLILVHGTENKTKSLYDKYLELSDMTREIYTPSVGEVLNVSEVTNMYKINLTDALLSSLSFSTLGEYDLAYLVGQVQIPPGSAAPVLGMPTIEAEGANKKQGPMGDVGGQHPSGQGQDQDAPASTSALQLLLQQQQMQQQQLEMLAREHRPVFVGDVKLTEFKDRVLKQAGIEAEFMSEGVLVCNGVVAIRKVDQTGQILLEGSPMSRDYYQVRQLLYKQFAIL